MFEFITALVPVLLKIAAFVVGSKIAWQLWWNRPGAGGRDIPGDTGWPFIGQSITFFSEGPRYFARRRHRLYGPVFKSHILGRPQVFLESSEDIKKCLLGEERIVIQQLPMPLHELIGKDSILGQHGDEHAENKMIMMQCLTPPCLQNLLNIMQPHMEAVISSWIEQSAGSKPVDVLPGITKIVFVLAQTLVYGEYDEDTNHRIEEHFHTMDRGWLTLPINLPFTPFGKGIAAKKALRVEMLKDVLAREEQRRGHPDPESSTCFLDMLIDHRHKKGDDSDPNYELLLSQMALGLSGPSLTTSSASFLLVHFLANHPELIQRLRQEKEEILGADDNTKLWDIATIKSLPLMDSVVREIMRQGPVANFVQRISIKSFELENGLEVPPGWGVFANLDSCMTHFAKIIDVDKFMPERFLKSSDKSYQPSQYECSFFGGGARRCPGQEIALLTLKMFLIVLIGKADFCYPPNYQVVVNDLPAAFPSDSTPCTLVFNSLQ